MMTEVRDQFEAWFADHSGQTIEWVKSQRETDKHYKIGPEIQRFWMAWQASRAAQPASPALKLPDEMVESGVNGRLYHNEGWNACLAEFKRLNAPHTAPIEPTGGAEWVKVPREPTRQMMSQGHFAMAGTDRGKFRRIYQAMIAAAPQPE